MKRVYSICLCLILISIIIFSCSTKDDIVIINNTPVSNDAFINNGSTKIVGDTVVQYILASDSNYVKMSLSTPEKYLPHKDDIICCTINKNTPLGYLGKVTSIEQQHDCYYIRIIHPSIDETFESLDINKNMDLTANIDSVVDENGNILSYTEVDNSVWSNLNSSLKNISERHLQSRSNEIDGNIHPTISVSVNYQPDENLSFRGNIYVSASCDFNINIAKHTLNDLNVKISPRIGIKGKFTATKETSFEKKYRVIRIPFRCVVGPLVLRPVLNVYLGGGVEGKAKMTSEIGYEFMNSSYLVTYQNGIWTEKKDDITRQNNEYATSEVELGGKAYLLGEANLLIGLYSERLLGVSFNTAGKLILSGNFSIDNKKLLVENPTVNVCGTLNGNLSLYANLFHKSLGKYTPISLSKTIFSKDYNLFPQITACDTYSNNSSSISIPYNLKANSLITSEYGLAIYGKNSDNIISNIKLGTSSIKASDDNIHATVISPSLGSDSLYYAAPYVKVMQHSFYGNKSRISIYSKKFSRIIMSFKKH